MFGQNKTCSRCGISKSVDLFSNYKHSSDGKKAACKSCQKAYNDKWDRENKEKKKDSARWWSIKNKYNISKEEYLSLLESQNHKCKICNLESSDNLHNYLYVDHCHQTNEIRGLLCKSCNSLLGMAKDDVEILENAIKYLKESNEKLSNLQRIVLQSLSTVEENFTNN